MTTTLTTTDRSFTLTVAFNDGSTQIVEGKRDIIGVSYGLANGQSNIDEVIWEHPEMSDDRYDALHDLLSAACDLISR